VAGRGDNPGRRRGQPGVLPGQLCAPGARGRGPGRTWPLAGADLRRALQRLHPEPRRAGRGRRPAGPGHRGRVLRDGRPPRRGSLELVGHHAWPVPQPWLLPLVLLVVLVLDAEVVLDLLLARLDLAVVLPAGLLAGHLRGLVQTLVRLLGVLARELLRLVHEFRHASPCFSYRHLVTQRRRLRDRWQPRAGEFRADPGRPGEIPGLAWTGWWRPW